MAPRAARSPPLGTGCWAAGAGHLTLGAMCRTRPSQAGPGWARPGKARQGSRQAGGKAKKTCTHVKAGPRSRIDLVPPQHLRASLVTRVRAELLRAGIDRVHAAWRGDLDHMLERGQACGVSHGVSEGAPALRDRSHVQLQAIHVTGRVRELVPTGSIAGSLLLQVLLHLPYNAFHLVVDEDLELRTQTAEALLAVPRLAEQLLPDILDLVLQTIVVLDNLHLDGGHISLQLLKRVVDIREQHLIIARASSRHRSRARTKDLARPRRQHRALGGAPEGAGGG
eukprot:CAMPEP_0175740470 /NCGR_PEP_ID=MMETSP0097-20121207/55528_1 /TAXON_ID=311494 /ORGANISM="Alexandrium monilatum, Strain CCMP3105" /LENGTH=281 /DNA_ID=CAMNT_0017048749 /DNA_START=30 /DNA_END=871 /DNA_ORIENTATION=+